MAYCPKCKNYISPIEIMTRAMVCKQCNKKLGFIRKEYSHVTRPGVFIVLLLLFNVYYTVDYQMKTILNLVILLVWFAFFKRYIDYLRKAELEIRE